MAIAETVSYGVMLTITLVFSILSLGVSMNKGNKTTVDWLAPILESVSFVGWIIMVPLHLGYVGVASIMLDAPAIFYFALAVIFLVLACRSALENVRASILSANSVETVD